MKKSLIIIIFILGITCIYCFYPHRVEHAVFLGSKDKSTTIYLNGKKTDLNISKINYPVFTVFNYKYNYFKVYGLSIVKASDDRVMVKGEKSYEIESRGNTSIAKIPTYYKYNKTNLEPCGSSELIVGKNNVKSFMNSSGSLMTFIISPVDYTNMRVGISTNNFSSLYHNKLQLISTSKLKLYCLVKKTFEEIPKNTLIEVDKTEKGMYTLINGVATLYSDRVYLNGGTIKILNLKRGFPEFVPEYSGTLELSFSVKGIGATSEVGLEDYLAKVVPSEMPDNGGIEALKCQSVAARTYAISDMLSNRFQGLGFYVDDSTKSQVYNNSNSTTLSSTAINSTKGLIMTFKNAPIDAKYFSTSCGTGVGSEDVWTKASGITQPAPYFRTVNYVSATVKNLPITEAAWLNFYKNRTITSIDSASPYYRWSIKVSMKELSNSLHKTVVDVYNKNKEYMVITENNKLVTKLPKLGELKDVQVIKRSRGGNVMSLKLIFDNASIVISGNTSIGPTLNLSKKYTGANTILSMLNSASLPSPVSLPSKFFSLEKSGDAFIIYGGGYGHGVGMSQYGAMDLSKNGWDFKRILNLYYKNISYTKLG